MRTPLPLQSLTNAQSLKLTNLNPIRAKLTKIFSHHQPHHYRWLQPMIAILASRRYSLLLASIKPEGAVKPKPILVVEPEGAVVATEHFCCLTSRTSTQSYSLRRRKCACSPRHRSSASRSFLPPTTSSLTTATTTPSTSSSIMALVAYCVVADESAGKQVPIAFLEQVNDDFVSKYSASNKAGTNAATNSLNKEFGSICNTTSITLRRKASLPRFRIRSLKLR
ncbi:hypothetical protein HN51_044982, partial [Arachis hypogaea]